MDANRKRGAMEKNLDDMLFGGGMPAPRRRRKEADAPADKPKEPTDKPKEPESKPSPLPESNKPAVNKSSDSVNRSQGGSKPPAK